MFTLLRVWVDSTHGLCLTHSFNLGGLFGIFFLIYEVVSRSKEENVN